MTNGVWCTLDSGGGRWVPIDQIQKRHSVYGVCIEDRKVLLLPQVHGGKRGYDFIGGGAEIEPTGGLSVVEHALQEEFLQESGLRITPEIGPFDVLAHQIDYHIHPGKGIAYQWGTSYYLVRNPMGEISADGQTEDEKGYCSKASWVPLEVAYRAHFFSSVDGPQLIRTAEAILA